MQQDTLVAMTALFKFTQVDPNRNVFDLMVRLESTATPTWYREHLLTKTDYTTLYRDSVSSNCFVIMPVEQWDIS